MHDTLPRGCSSAFPAEGSAIAIARTATSSSAGESSARLSERNRCVDSRLPPVAGADVDPSAIHPNVINSLPATQLGVNPAAPCAIDAPAQPAGENRDSAVNSSWNDRRQLIDLATRPLKPAALSALGDTNFSRFRDRRDAPRIDHGMAACGADLAAAMRCDACAGSGVHAHFFPKGCSICGGSGVAMRP